MTALVLIVIPQYILATVIATLVVYWGARLFTKSNWPYRLVLIAAFAWPVGDVLLSKAVLGAYCWDKSGIKINRIVENVEGFFVTETGCSGSCQEALIKNKIYRFIEAEVAELEDYRNPLGRFETSTERYEDALVPGPGLYRFTREEPGHPKCKIYDTWLSKKKGLKDREEYKNNCVATWNIRERKSKYSIGSFYDEDSTIIGEIFHHGYRYIDLKTQEILAEKASFGLRSKLFWSTAFNPLYCGPGIGGIEDHEVLKPVL